MQTLLSLHDNRLRGWGDWNQHTPFYKASTQTDRFESGKLVLLIFCLQITVFDMNKHEEELDVAILSALLKGFQSLFWYFLCAYNDASLCMMVECAGWFLYWKQNSQQRWTRNRKMAIMKGFYCGITSYTLKTILSLIVLGLKFSNVCIEYN